MDIHYFQHVPYEGLGSIENWADKPGNKLTATKFYEDHRLPFIDLFEMLIVMGGPMGAGDDHKYSWMKAEKKMIENAIKKDKIVVGICLGAQLIADVLGAKVYPNKYKEIGWFPIRLTAAGKEKNLLEMNQDTLQVFHWHGDTFDLPQGALHLAETEGCANQAFSYGTNVIGLQFHLEATPFSIAQFIREGQKEIVPGKYIQSPAAMMAAEAELYRTNHSIMSTLLHKAASVKSVNKKSSV